MDDINEKKIQERLEKTVMIVAATGVILLAAAGFFGFFCWILSNGQGYQMGRGIITESRSAQKSLLNSI